MSWIDFILGVAVLAIVPFALAAYGGHLAAEMLSDPVRRRKTKGRFWLLCVAGILVAAAYQYRTAKNDEEHRYQSAQTDSERQKRMEELQQRALLAEADLVQMEKANRDLVLSVQKTVRGILERPQSAENKTAAGELSRTLSEDLPPIVRNPQPVQVPSTILQLPQSAPSPPPAPKTTCRGDHLSECTDAELLEWSAPLMNRLNSIMNEHDKAQRELDAIKDPNVFAALFGKDKWLNKFEEMQHDASDQFRDCCAEDVLRYHTELVLRTGAGARNRDYYKWTELLLKPAKSRDWKKAREDGSNAVQIYYDLQILEIRLKSKPLRTRG
jgi:hypothetical protein